jgi:hypothetical protein
MFNNIGNMEKPEYLANPKTILADMYGMNVII